jgi:hypothetical protein
MTLVAARPEVAEEIEAAEAIRKDAEAAYFAVLHTIVDLSTLTGGRDGYDFYVCVPASDMHMKTQQIVGLEHDIRDRFGVHLRTYAIATA